MERVMNTRGREASSERRQRQVKVRPDLKLQFALLQHNQVPSLHEAEQLTDERLLLQLSKVLLFPHQSCSSCNVSLHPTCLMPHLRKPAH